MTRWWNSGPDLKVICFTLETDFEDIIFKVDCICFASCSYMPRIPCFFLQEHLFWGEAGVGRPSYIVYFSY